MKVPDENVPETSISANSSIGADRMRAIAGPPLSVFGAIEHKTQPGSWGNQFTNKYTLPRPTCLENDLAKNLPRETALR